VEWYNIIEKGIEDIKKIIKVCKKRGAKT